MNEIEKRTAAALTAIKQSIKDEESGLVLFATHHREELPSQYWVKYLGKDSPSVEEIFSILVLGAHWSEEDDDGIDFFDFTLPENVTDYLISVQFDDQGNVEDISMES